MSLYKRFALKGALAGVLVAAATIAGSILFSGSPVKATDAGDCGPSSIITCGVKSVDEAIAKYNANSTIQGTFNAFGISTSDLNKLKSSAVIGTIYNNFFDGHDVIVVDNKIVAINSITAGRVNVSGSTLLGNFGGVNIYQRPYHLSNHRPKQVFVHMENGEFKFGIIAECGNPVVGDTPKIALDKEISKDGVNFSENANFKDGETATFRITVKETNGGFASNVTVKDKLPKGYTYVAGSTKLDGKKVTDITDGPINIGGLKPYESKSVTFKAKVNLVGKLCGTAKIPNTAVVDSDQTGPQDDDANSTVTKDCVAKCESLSGPTSLDAGKTAVYRAKVELKNTEVEKYVFTVDGKRVQSGKESSYTYTAEENGKHTIAVVVHFNNGTKDGGDGNCAKTVKTVEAPEVLVCESLNANPNVNTIKLGQTVKYTVSARAENVEIKGFIFRVNGEKVKETNSANNNTFDFKPTEAGDYKIRVFVKGSNDRVVTSDSCVKNLKANPLPVVELKCDGLTPKSRNLKPGQSVTFTATGSAKNTKVTGYVFTLDGEKVKESNTPANNTYVFTADEAGTYRVKAMVKGENGATATSADCEATVRVSELPTPLLECNILTVSKTSVQKDEEVTFTASGTAENTVITGYVFMLNGVKVKETNNATQNTYVFKSNVAGQYTVKAIVKGENGATATNDTTCVKTIRVNEEVLPVYTCDMLKVTPSNLRVNTKTVAEVDFTAENGAVFKSATFDFGDETTPVVVTDSSNGKARAEHTYAKNGEFTAKVNLVFTVNGQDRIVNGTLSNGCAQEVIVSDVCKWDETLPPDSEDCFEPCPIPGKEEYAKDDVDNCVVDELPQTGAGNMLGLFTVTSFLGAFAYRMRVIRGNR